MKKTIIVCDKCGREIPEKAVIQIMDEVDICPKCWPKLKTALMAWLKEQEEGKPRGRKSAEKQEPEQEPAKDPDPGKVDLGKMQALRNSGRWSVKEIAAEMKVSESFVYAHTTAPEKKKAYPNEFNAADPREVAR